MERKKAEMGRVREEKRRKKIKKEKVRSKKVQVRERCEKVGRSPNTVFLQ